MVRTSPRSASPKRRVAATGDDAELLDRVLRSVQVVRADGENFGVVRRYGVVVAGQLDELATAERSPERAVEHEHDVLLVQER